MPELLMAAIEQLHLPKTLFAGQTVLVTGSGQGIGKAAAQAFASLGDWQHLLSALHEALENAAKGDSSVLTRFRSQHPDFNLDLARLRDCFAAEPAQAARFSKDQEFLAEAARIAGRRVAAVEGLIQALKAV